MITLSSPIDLIKKSFEIFFKKENIKIFILIYLPLVPFVFLSLFKFKDSWQAWIIGGMSFAQIFVFAIVTPAAIVAVGNIVSGTKISVKQAFNYASKIYWKFLLLSVLLTLILGFGFVLLIIPGILFMVWYSFSRFIVVEDNKIGVIAALNRSKNLVKNRFWAIFARVIVFGIFTLLAGMLPFVSTVFGALFVLPLYLLYRELVLVDNN